MILVICDPHEHSNTAFSGTLFGEKFNDVYFESVGREPLGLRFFLGGPTVDLRTEDRWFDVSGALCGRACAGPIGRSAGRHAVRVAARQGSAFAFASAIRTADGVKSVSKKTLISGIVPGRIPTVSGFVFSRDDSRDGDEGDVSHRAHQHRTPSVSGSNIFFKKRCRPWDSHTARVAGQSETINHCSAATKIRSPGFDPPTLISITKTLNSVAPLD